MLYKLIITGMLIFILVSCNKEEGPIQTMSDLKNRVDKLSELTRDVENKRTELYSLIENFNNNLPENAHFDIANIDTTIGASEQELLRVMFKQEKDITYNGLLKTIIEKNNEISNLNEQIAELSNKLPIPYTVQKGDTHYEIVMQYLVSKHGMMKNEAHKVAFSTAMIDDILPGNQVWLMFNNGIIGTYVTKGTAKIDPMKYQMIAKKRLIEKSKMLSSLQKPTINLANVK